LSLRAEVEMSGISIVIVNSPEQALSLTSKVQKIGRANGCDLCIPAQYASVSRQHASVWMDSAGECWIEDCDSTCGVRINRVRLPKGGKSRILPGDEIQLGNIDLRVLAAGETLPPPPETHELASTLPIGATELYEEPWGSLESLTPAELEIVLWMSRGFTSLEELSEKLSRSPHTIRTHLSSIFSKLDVHSKDALLAFVRRLP
jgi:DNA-binding CsgD family transcriptional regulator